MYENALHGFNGLICFKDGWLTHRSDRAVLEAWKECAQAFGQVSELSPHSGDSLPFFWFLRKANLHMLMMSAQIWHAISPLQKTFTKIKHFPLVLKG